MFSTVDVGLASYCRRMRNFTVTDEVRDYAVGHPRPDDVFIG